MHDSGPVLPRLSVAVVVYNSPLAPLGATLASLFDAAGRALGGALASVQVTLIDNGSGRQYLAALRRELDALSPPEGVQLSLLCLDDNRGFGAGHNRAAAAACGDYHLVLNPDVELAATALSVGIGYLQAHPGVVLASPRVTGSGGEQEFLCKSYPSVLVLALRAFLPRLGRRLFPGRMAAYEMRTACSSGQACPVTLASGCFMLLRGPQFASVGGFDEDYFLYFEDFDLSLRLAALGELRFLPQMQIVHHGGYAARKGGGHLKMFVRSGLRFFRRHGWRWI